MEPQEPGFLAARLALLALRATISQATALAADRVLLDAAGAPVSTDDAAQLLASKPKPLFCDATARDGMLVVSCKAQSEADEHRLRKFEIQRGDEEEHGGFMSFLYDRYGAADHLVAAFGRDESLTVPLSVVERWSREYDIVGANMSGYDVVNLSSSSRPEYLEARRSGAKGILHFSSQKDAEGSDVSFITLYSDGENVLILSDEAAEQAVQMARTNHMKLRALIDSAGSTLDASHREQVEAVAKGQLMHTVEMLKRGFKDRTMPPDVAAFVEECEKDFG